MSDLYSITVLARDGVVVDLAVDIVHPDVVDIPLSPELRGDARRGRVGAGRGGVQGVVAGVG